MSGVGDEKEDGSHEVEMAGPLEELLARRRPGTVRRSSR